MSSLLIWFKKKEKPDIIASQNQKPFFKNIPVTDLTQLQYF